MALRIHSSYVAFASFALSSALCACSNSSTAPAADAGLDGTTQTDGSSDDARPSKDSGKDATEKDAAGEGGVAEVGPGANLLCKSSGKNAFETYKTAGFVAVNKAIFANVGAELGPEAGDAGAGLGPTFGAVGTGKLDGKSVPALDDSIAMFEGKLAAYLVFAFGGPTSIEYTDKKTYSGLTDLVKAHTGLGITPDQYSYFIASDVVPALTSAGVTTDDIDSCFAPLVLSTTFMQEIVGDGASAGYALKCSSGKNAFDTYGADAFVKVNESIFANVGTQESSDAGVAGLGTTFQFVGSGKLDDASVPALDDSAATFKGKLAAFLVWSFGGPTEITYTDKKVYSGIQGLTAEHTGLGITADQYGYFVTNVVIPALTSNGVKKDDVTACFAPVISDPAFMAQVVGQ